MFFFNDTATTEIYTLSLHHALPIWACPEERQNLRYVVPLGSHRRRAPDHDPDGLRIPLLFFEVAPQKVVRKPLPNLPRERARQRLRVNRVEVAPRGQHVGEPPRRRPRRPRWHVPTRKPSQEVP